MATNVTTRSTAPYTIENLTADREKMWSGFTNATTGVVIFLVFLLIGMAVFLL